MTLKTLKEGMDWLYQQTVDHPRLGLDAMHQALAYFNNPHQNLSVIHITGTNGKGSTTAFLTQLLLNHNQTVVTLTSPHIMSFNERYQLNGQNIDDDTLLNLLNQVKEYNEYLRQKDEINLSTYEIITLLGILFAGHVQPDVFIAEVGIGGLLDTTNVLTGEIAVITTIGVDHADKLGDTLREVAYQKAGIIKPRAQVITGAITKEPLTVIEDCAKDHDAQMYEIENDFYAVPTGVGMEWNYQFKQWYFTKLPCSLLGRHQIDNAAVALTTFITWMTKRSIVIEEEKIRTALSKTRWMARMEKISDRPLIYLDGAHNAAGLESLAQTLSTYYPDISLSILFAGLDTKNQQEHLHWLAEMEPKRVYLTTFSHPQAFTLDQFQKALEDEKSSLDHVHLTKDWESVVKGYIEKEKEIDNQLLLVTGSLYFVSNVREYLLEK